MEEGGLIVGTLRSQHLQRVALNASGQLQRHEDWPRGGNGYGQA